MERKIKHICSQCGACCKEQNGEECTVLIFPSELEMIAQACRKSCMEFVEQYCVMDEMELSGVGIPVLRLKFQNHSCIFLNQHNQCDIYESRPYQCRMFDEGYFSEFILSERSLPCTAGMDLSEWMEQGNDREVALAMELLNGYTIDG